MYDFENKRVSPARFLPRGKDFARAEGRAGRQIGLHSARHENALVFDARYMCMIRRAFL